MKIIGLMLEAIFQVVTSLLVENYFSSHYLPPD